MPLSSLRTLPEPRTGPEDRHVFVVCTGEACAGAGAGDLLDTLRSECRHTQRDVRIGASQCIGRCQLAPAMLEDGRMVGCVSRRRLRAELRRLGVVEPTRSY